MYVPYNARAKDWLTEGFNLLIQQDFVRSTRPGLSQQRSIDGGDRTPPRSVRQAAMLQDGMTAEALCCRNFFHELCIAFNG